MDTNKLNQGCFLGHFIYRSYSYRERNSDSDIADHAVTGILRVLGGFHSKSQPGELIQFTIRWRKRASERVNFCIKQIGNSEVRIESGVLRWPVLSITNRRADGDDGLDKLGKVTS